jgi:hypothetical protein
MNQREAELQSQGWTRRFVGAPPRLKEMVELYQSLGFEVHLERYAPEDLDGGCDGCRLALDLFRVVYTRPSGAGELARGRKPGSEECPANTVLKVSGF